MSRARWALVAGLLATAQVRAQQYQLTLPLDTNFGPTVEAVVDLQQMFGAEAGPPNPFIYDCVAFVQVVHRGESTPLRLQREGPRSWRREIVWVGLAGDAPRRRHPRLIGITGPNKETLVVPLEPENSMAEYEIGVDSAEVLDSGAPHVVKGLVTARFAIPPSDVARCGRLPRFETNLLAPDGEHPGWGVDFDMVWRRGVRLAGGGLLQVRGRGGFTTSDRSMLFNAVSTDARFDIKLTRGWRRWISVGVVEGLEATERLDVVDLALGATARVRLDFLPVAPLRRLVRRFTPFPMLTMEYNLVDRLSGEGNPALAGRPDSEHRVRAGVDWTVPAIMGTTIRAKLRADYLLSDIPAGQQRLRTLHDVSVEYPVNSANDAAIVVQWLTGRAAPTYQLATRWLTGVGIRM